MCTLSCGSHPEFEGILYGSHGVHRHGCARRVDGNQMKTPRDLFDFHNRERVCARVGVVEGVPFAIDLLSESGVSLTECGEEREARVTSDPTPLCIIRLSGSFWVEDQAVIFVCCAVLVSGFKASGHSKVFHPEQLSEVPDFHGVSSLKKVFCGVCEGKTEVESMNSHIGSPNGGLIGS